MQGEQAAIMKAPPRPNGVALDVTGTNQVTLVAATTSALQTLPTNGGYWLTLVCTADTRLRFGVGADPGNATAADYLSLPAFAEREYWITSETHFRAFSTPGGTLDWYRSSR
jgi:hypothetical protein